MKTLPAHHDKKSQKANNKKQPEYLRSDTHQHQPTNSNIHQKATTPHQQNCKTQIEKDALRKLSQNLIVPKYPNSQQKSDIDNQLNQHKKKA